MGMNQGPANIEVFKLAPGDIDHLFRRSGVPGNLLANFRYNAEQAAVSSPSQWFKALTENPVFPAVTRQLLAPDLKISFHTGGSHAAEDQYHALLSRESSTVLGLFVNSEGYLLLMLFPDGESFLEWWAGIYASPGMGDYPAVFDGGLLETEVLVCALHCIDLYRRFYLESMLDYRAAGVDLSISTADFVQLLKRSLASGDKRWLLPTLYELTPGLKQVPVALKPEHLKKIKELGFITGKESVFTLGERSRLMGTEFVSTWMNATGWQASALIQGQERSLSRVFLAATAFANHLFSFETGSGGEGRFRHQAASASQLAGTLRQWLETVKKVTGSAPASAKPAEDAAPRASFCGQCGSAIRPGKKFCSRCGASI
ncbi:MAG: zinc ribbon domain-containing protein [Firmicutes bacterium]|nr:zinc ribbon domain-containing protein [Bacillota bacterium]